MKLKLIANPPSESNVLEIEPEIDLTQDCERIKALLKTTSVVQLRLPKFTDGRAYSQAIVLRKRLVYQAKLRIVGDVLADQVQALLRVGFDQIQLRADQVPEVLDGVLGIVSRFYQPPFEPSVSAQAQIWLAQKEPAAGKEPAYG
jgi:uncharacterized protein (DUF934 family)